MQKRLSDVEAQLELAKANVGDVVQLQSPAVTSSTSAIQSAMLSSTSVCALLPQRVAGADLPFALFTIRFRQIRIKRGAMILTKITRYNSAVH